VRMMLHRLAMVAALLWIGTAGATPRDAALNEQLSDLGPEVRAKVEKFIDGFLRRPDDPQRPPGALGWDCLAAIVLTEAQVPGAEQRLRRIGARLVASALRTPISGQAVGWPAPPHFPACEAAHKDETSAVQCAADRTVYGYQTGLGLACLTRASVLLKQPEWQLVSQQVWSYWQNRTLQVDCQDCRFFASSDSDVDRERYVRNMNLFMAFAAWELGNALREEGPVTAATNAVRADQFERAQGNRGYLGRLDPIWSNRKGEDRRIENHTAFSAALLHALALRIHSSQIMSHALATWDDWATCTERRCLALACNYWAADANKCLETATGAHCAFRRQSELARSQCATYVLRARAVSAFGLWALLSAAPH
jgi:hypothetical protein